MIGNATSRNSLVTFAAIAMALFVGQDANAMQRGDRERRPQEAIAADLSSGDPDRIGPAFAEMSSMPPSEWGAELRGALLDPKHTPYYQRSGCKPDREFPKPPNCPG